MHNTKIHNPIYLVHEERGTVFTFNCFDTVVTYWPFLKKLDIGKTFKHVPRNVNTWYQWDWTGNSSGRHDYILRDSYGDPIDVDGVRRAYHKRFSHPLLRGPHRMVPGSRTRTRYNGYRRLRTTNERRQIDACNDEEDAPTVRPCRNHNHLPNSWDDFLRSDHYDRCWKRNRRHQWKEGK